jgi:hypothetical protein
VADTKRLPVDVARQIGESHAKDIVLVVTWDAATEKTSIVTWGREPGHKAAAAQGGDAIAQHLGLDLAQAEVHQDYRREGEAAREVDRLLRACRTIRQLHEQMLQMLAIRGCVSDVLLRNIRVELHDALRSA